MQLLKMALQNCKSCMLVKIRNMFIGNFFKLDLHNTNTNSNSNYKHQNVDNNYHQTNQHMCIYVMQISNA